MKDQSAKLSTEPYKGVRDFFPADMSVQKKIFAIWRSIAERYGYQEYAASVLEPADLYAAKTGEEIVNEQTYTFTDRGDRHVTLRPEMTPTVARMVAARKRELIFPLRWYSIPNLFRYEQPQRGRTREHWQLNVDLFGVESRNAEVEVINMAYDIVHACGLANNPFEIRLNNRRLMNYVTQDVFGLDETAAKKMSKLIDKKEKLKPEAFELGVRDIFGPQPVDTAVAPAREQTPDRRVQEFLTLLNSKNFEEFTSHLPQTSEEHQGLREIREVMAGLERLGITNVRFDQTLMRGFDYYTGIVFEIFDLNPANRRSVFGGGRYDDLLALFGNDKVTAFGFGAGDLIARDLMETYGTLPTAEAPADLAICIVGEQNTPFALDLAQDMRAQGLRVSVDLSHKKLSDQLSAAARRSIACIVCVGDEEVRTGKLRLKTLATQTEVVVTENELAMRVKEGKE